MIKQITSTFTLTQAQEAILDGLKPFQPGVWTSSAVSDIKEEIHNQLIRIQSDNCCYCGLRLNEGGRAEIEHIANKGGVKRPKYIEFVFTKKNLAIACQFCNSSSKKGQIDTLLNVDSANYENCTFKIVHPYFDNPNIHYEWSKGKFEILISAISDEGKESIKLFGLDSEAHTFARAKQAMFDEKLSKYRAKQAIKNRIIEIFRFKQ